MARWQNYIIPALLLVCLPADLTAAFARGTYPTLLSLLAIIEFVAGIWLARRSGRSTALIAATADNNIELPAEEIAATAANLRLNRMLGAGLIIFGLLLTIFMLASFLLITPRTTSGSTTISSFVEIGFALLFNLLVSCLILAGTRIYALGTNAITQMNADKHR